MRLKISYNLFIFFLACLLPQITLAALRQAEDGIVKILAIGNSFSADAIEQNLYDLAKEKNLKVVIANLYIGGAPLTLHVKNVEENKPAYSYRKTSVDGSKSKTEKVSIQTALNDEEWDYISFQQASPLSGQIQTIEASLPTLFTYVKSRAKNPDVKYVYHQTWAYAADAKHTGFSNYDRDQLKMYEGITAVAKQVKNIAPIDLVVPAGTAIQNARTSYIGDQFTRDGYHLSIPLGQYVAACAWFEKIFKTSVVGIQFKPEGMSELEKIVAQKAAHAAVKRPYKITRLKKYTKESKQVRAKTAAQVSPILPLSYSHSWAVQVQ